MSSPPKPVRFIIQLSITLFLTMVLLIIAGILLLGLFSKGLCGNEVFQEIPSPNNEYKVVVFQRDCGATTGFSTQVSILGANAQLPNKAGNVLRMDGHPDWTKVEVRWESDDSLRITRNNEYEVFSMETRFRDLFTVINIEQ